MKDFGYYKNIINQNYNPKKEILTEKKFYGLQRAILAGYEESEKELFNLTCFFSYELVAHAFAEGLLKGDFEDALQETYLILQNANAHAPKNLADANFEGYIQAFSTRVLKKLSKIENENERQSNAIDVQKSSEINNALQSPEDVAITKMIRPKIAEIVDESARGKTDAAIKRHAQWVHEKFIDGYTQGDISKEAGVTRQAVSAVCTRSTRILRYPSNKARLSDLLHK